MWAIVEMRWAYDDIDYINVIGPYNTFEEACAQAQVLRDNDPHRHVSTSLSYSVKPLIMPQEEGK
jgi:hypothetical protein